MIDIHSHIVFDVDDGPKTREDTCLIKESYRQGVRTIILLLIVARGCLKLPKKRFLKIFKK